MAVHRLAIDWDALETALTWRMDEGGQYLDLATGEVVPWMGSRTTRPGLPVS